MSRRSGAGAYGIGRSRDGTIVEEPLPERLLGPYPAVSRDSEGYGAGIFSLALIGDERELVAALRRGDERAFADLLATHHQPMLRLARRYVEGWAVAEEVVQETWLKVIRGLEGFEGRASLRSWIFRILINTALDRATRERRSRPFSSLAFELEDAGQPAVEPFRFRNDGWWAHPPQSFGEPETALARRELRGYLERAIAALPPRQRAVLILRDVEGWRSAEVAATLELSDSNERVLLHRARARVRSALERELGGESRA